jgi:hypothetical protein
MPPQGKSVPSIPATTGITGTGIADTTASSQMNDPPIKDREPVILPHCPVCNGRHIGRCTYLLAGFKPKPKQ